jgi:hypothetical protein
VGDEGGWGRSDGDVCVDVDVIVRVQGISWDVQGCLRR